MTTLQGAFVTVGLGSINPKYMWNGKELQGIIKMFVYHGTSITLTCKDKSLLPLNELKTYGIKIKEIK